MPQERFTISKFDKGIIKRGDSADIPDNAASDSNNIDGSAPFGVLKAIPTSANKSLGTTTLNTGRLFEWIKTKDNKWNLVYVGIGYANLVTDFYGTTPASYFGATAIASTGTSMVAHNEEVRIANGVNTGVPTSPIWLGNCDYGHFGGAVKSWQYANAKLDAVDVCSFGSAFVLGVTPNAGTMAFNSGSTYYYTLTAVYDGIQESPIMQRNTGGGVTNYFVASSNYDDVTISINLTVSGLSNRITAVKLYRKELNSNGEITLWRLQKTFDITASVAYVDRTGTNQSWGTSGGDKTLTYVDNNTDILSSYEEQSGMPETLASSDVYYSLNCDLNSYHFVANCYKSSIPESAFLMFRSKQYRYDTFDWTADYLKLPTIPTALKAFNGKIWAFDENNIYRINPDGMYIEDITTGIGCLSQRSIVVTDYGMFWCDYKNAYMFDGEQIIPIGEDVRTDVTSIIDWTGKTKIYTVGEQTKTPVVIFDSTKNYVLFMVFTDSPGNGKSHVWAYHVQNKRWDFWQSFSECDSFTIGFGAFTGRNGETYVADSTYIVEAFGGASYRSFYWTSKIIDFGEPSRQKVFYRPIMDNTVLTSAPVITYGKDRSAPSTSLTGGEFISGGNFEEGKLLQVKITEATGYGNSVYSLDIILRKMFEL